jgi:cytidylate kinase
MYASAQVRATRRHEELTQSGVDVSYQEILEDVSRRDHLDQSRELGALIKAPDAVEMDTSAATPDQVAEEIIKLAKK